MPPMTLMIKPSSSSCNLRCDYCFYFDEAAHREIPNYGMMSYETLETLLRRAIAYAEGQLSLVFQGGEPTIVGIDFFKKLLEFEARYNTKDLKISHSIQTNGYDLSDDLIDLLISADFLFGISIDGHAAIHDRYRKTASGEGTYETVKASLDRIIERGGEANVLCVVTQDIAREARTVFGELKSYQYMQFIPCLDRLDGTLAPYSLDPKTYGRFLIETYDLYEEALLNGEELSVRHFDNYLQMVQGYPPEGCAMSGTCAPYFLAEADGSIFPCDFYALDQNKLGNIHEASFFKLAKTDRAKEFLAESIQKPQQCMTCRWFGLCRNGCKRERPEGEDMFGVNQWCDSYMAFFDARGERLIDLSNRLFSGMRR